MDVQKGKAEGKAREDQLHLFAGMAGPAFLPLPSRLRAGAFLPGSCRAAHPPIRVLLIASSPIVRLRAECATDASQQRQ